MAIENTYRQLLINSYIKDQLSRGVDIDAETVEQELEDLLENMDLTAPQFVSEDFHVASKEASSVSKHVETFSSIKQDLRVLFKEAIKLTSTSRDSFERWKLETSSIEKKLIDLDDRIENLLILTQDTEGYHSIIVENFTDTFNVDLSETSASINLDSASVQMNPTTGTFSRIFLEGIDPGTDLSFKVRSTIDFVNRTDAVNSELSNIFKQDSRSWWTSIGMRKPNPVTCELTIKLGETPVEISKIFIDLHDSLESSPMVITPLYSVDNQTYNQIPSNTFTMEVRGSTDFTFSTVEAKWIKFILVKEGPDSGNQNNIFSYQFGFKEIAIYEQGFSSTSLGDVTQKVISRPRYQLGFDGLAQQFEKLTLETCERIETDTDIKYFVTTSNDPLVPLSALTRWIPVSPLNRASPEYPQLITVGEANETIIGINEDMQISYAGTSIEAAFRNPAESFHLLSQDPSSGEIIDETISVASPTAIRYRFANSEDRLLNYQIKLDDSGSGTGLGIEINETTMLLFRNVGAKGLNPTVQSSFVRGVQRGWKYEDPYYISVIEILNPDGMSIDVGDKPIWIDDIKYTHRIDGTILTGKTTTSTGVHTVKVHKSNWKSVISGAADLPTLRGLDTLYPYNHKLLIEGYDYGSSFSTSDKIYLGADIFAETLMRKISIFDLMRNVSKDNYKVYSLDKDAPNTHTGDNNPTKVFVIKVDEESSDFQNERFVLRFTQINQLQKYLRIRADFTTENEKITPSLHSYKIKLG